MTDLESISKLDLNTHISTFNNPLSLYIESLGLPTHNVLYPIVEREKILKNLSSSLFLLSEDDKKTSFYLSKFTVAVSVGLFDSALNYLWNETILALRKLIEKFDLSYFFSLAKEINNKYKQLNNIEDLIEIGDHDLLEISRRIGLISDLYHKKLTLINYMRNHASAAHPNENEIGGFELLGWIEDCIKYIIKAEPDTGLINLQQLLSNLRNKTIPMEDFPYICSQLQLLPQERIDALLLSIFGMYTDPKSSVILLNNLKNIISSIWNLSSQDRKYEIGLKYGLYRNSGELEKKDLANEFLTIVDGIRFKDEDSITLELLEKITLLKNAHFSSGNFYNERVFAKMLKDLIPDNGKIPKSIKKDFVKVIVMCYCGNGLGYYSGVDEGAIPFYKEFIENFGDDEIIAFLSLLADNEFVVDLYLPKPDKRFRQVTTYLNRKTNNILLKKASEEILKMPEGKLCDVTRVTEFKRLLKEI